MYMYAQQKARSILLYNIAKAAVVFVEMLCKNEAIHFATR